MENLENPIEVAIKKLAKHAEMQATEIYFNRTVGWSTKLNELMVGIIKTSREAGRLQGISEAEGVVPEALLEAGFSPEGLHGKLMYNRCRQKTLDNLTKLKGKE